MIRKLLLSKAINAALLAGKHILAIYNDPLMDFQIEKKTDNSPLTIADKKAHEVIAGILSETSYPLLSEEGDCMPFPIRNSWETLWLIDPLDGTKEFIKRNGEFTVNIALIHQGIPVLGVVYLPVKHILYFAEESLGAYKYEKITEQLDISLEVLLREALRLPQNEARENFVIVASRSHLSSETELYIEQMKKLHQYVDFISCGSSIKICLVAEGKADVYPRFAPTMEWDTAAGHAIARAAGKEVYQVDKNIPLIYNKEKLYNPWFVVK